MSENWIQAMNRCTGPDAVSAPFDAQTLAQIAVVRPDLLPEMNGALTASAAPPAQEPPTAPRWQSMETAPKDGTEVLLRVKLRAGMPGRCLVGHYMEGGHCIEDHPPIDRGWYFWNGSMFDRAAEPVEWMALPTAQAPPAQEPPTQPKEQP
jgi:hypothetical protein